MLKKFLVLSALVLLLFPSCQSEQGDAVTGEDVVKAAVLTMVEGTSDQVMENYSASRGDSRAELPFPISIPEITIEPGVALSGSIKSLNLDLQSQLITLGGEITVTFTAFPVEGCLVTGPVTCEFELAVNTPVDGEPSFRSVTVTLEGDLDLAGVLYGPVTFSGLELAYDGSTLEYQAGSLKIFGQNLDIDALIDLF